MGDGNPDMSAERRAPAKEEERSERWSVVSRRTMLKAGWSVPVILTVAPAAAFAASGVGPTPTHTTQQQPTSSTNSGTSNSQANTPSGPGTPQSNTPSGPGTSQSNVPSATPASTGSSPGGGASGGLPQQQSGGPQPARINRGFTG